MSGGTLVASLSGLPERDRPFLVELTGFSGPLDLLLSLIRDEQVDIYDIPIARIAEQFLARVHQLALDDASDYLEMAARLLRIKAQLLLPRPEDPDGWEDPRADLVRRLLEYQQIREVVDVLEVRAEERRTRFARAFFPAAAVETGPSGPTPLAASLTDLFAAVDRVLRMARRPSVHDVVPRALDVDGSMATVRGVLSLRARAIWRELLPPTPEPWQILSLLLAVLELARRGELRILQPRSFADVEIFRDTAGEAA